VHLAWSAIFYILFGLIIIALCGIGYGTLLAILGTRYRDIKQMVVSLIQVVFLITPIMWQPSMLPAQYKFAANLNPFNHIISLLREPLTGHSPSSFTLMISLVIALVGIISLVLILKRTRHRIPFWV
jgi:ABC-type polysaccharide/polyol phosphate export permease